MKIIDIVPIKNWGNLKKLPKNKRVEKILPKLKKQNYKCNYCSAIALEFIILYNEKSKKFEYYINSINSNGEESRMTLDHIIPKSRNGKLNSSNCQVLCLKCNQKKGNKIKNESRTI